MADCQAAMRMSAVDIAGIGVCGFHHCPVFLDAEGKPVRPTVVTHDSRLGESLEDLRRSGVLQEVIEISGSQVMTGHFPPIYHLIAQHGPEALAATRWIVLAKDFLRFKLTGEIGTEICDATGTNLVAMPQQEWSDALCALMRVPRERLPEIGKPGQVSGQVSAEAARATGLRAGTPVVYGGGDSHCALVGLGVVGSGEAGLLLGTNSTLRASFGRAVQLPDRAVWMQQHVVTGQYTVSASSMAGSSILSWFMGLCPDNAEGQASAYRHLASLAAEVPPGCDGLLFHPYLYGERSPFSNPNARGGFLSIAHWHTRPHFARAVMEGVAFSIANCVDAIQSIAREQGESLRTIRTGQSGGSRLPIWLQIIADVLGRPLDLMEAGEPGCLGAAILAGVGIGEYGDTQSAIGQAVRIVRRIDPDSDCVTLYRDRRAAFNAAYQALEPVLYQQSKPAEAR